MTTTATQPRPSTLHSPGTLTSLPTLTSVPAQRPSLTPEPIAPVAALRLTPHVLRVVGPLLEDAGFEVLDITAHERGPRPHLVVLELPEDEEAGRRLLAPPQNGQTSRPGRLFLASDEVSGWATVQWPGDEIVHSPYHRLQVVAAALRVGRLPVEAVADWSSRAFDDLGAAQALADAAESRTARAS